MCGARADGWYETGGGGEWEAPRNWRGKYLEGWRFSMHGGVLNAGMEQLDWEMGCRAMRCKCAADVGVDGGKVSKEARSQLAHKSRGDGRDEVQLCEILFEDKNDSMSCECGVESRESAREFG